MNALRPVVTVTVLLTCASLARAQSQVASHLPPTAPAGDSAAPLETFARRPPIEFVFEDAPSATAWGVAGYGVGLGVGARMTLPVADGVLPARWLRDSFALDLGADYVGFGLPEPAGGRWTILRPSAGLLWTLRLSDHVAIYPKVELGWDLARYHGPRGSEPPSSRHGGLHAEAIGGLLLSFGPVTVRAESGWGYVKAGVGFVL